MPTSSWPAPDPQDVASPAALLRAWDAALTFPPGGAPDTDRLRSLFLPTASVASPSAGGGTWLDADGFAGFLVEGLRAAGWDALGFGERNALVRHDALGRLHALLTTFTIHLPADADEPAEHGVNLFHLVERDGRLAIASYAWQDLDGPWDGASASAAPAEVVS